MRKHLAIFSQNAALQIFSGEKTIESRFSIKKIAPFGQIAVGDLVYIKPSGKDILGQFRVKKVISFEGIDSQDWQVIKEKYGKYLSLGSKKEDDEFFRAHKGAKFGTIIFIGQVDKFITSPIKIKKNDQRGWMVLI